MPNPPSKGDEDLPAHSRATIAKTHHTRSAAVPTDICANPTPGSRTGSNQVETDFSSLSSLQHVAHVITEIITRHKMSSQVKLLLEGVIKFTKEEEDRERRQKTT